MKRVKILRIIARLNIGGPAIHAILLTSRLNKDKFESVLLTGPVGSEEGDMSYFARENDVAPVLIYELGREISWKDDLIALYKIFKLISAINPDIVHTHTAKAGTLGRCAVILYNNLLFVKNSFKKIKRLFSFFKTEKKSLRKIKLFHTFHGHVFHGYFGRGKTNLFIFIERCLALFTDKVITISSKQADDMCDKYKIVNRKKVSVVPLGFDLSKFFDSKYSGEQFKIEYGLNKEVVLVGIVGRLVPIKNHLMFFDAVKIFCRQCTDISVKFVVVGDGELRNNLNDYVGKLGIEDHVIFAGWHADLDRIYAALDLVVLTSFNEGTPVSLIEAMASGKPIVATDVGGVRDLMGDLRENLEINRKVDVFDNGILVESGDSQGFADAVEFLIKEGKYREEMGERGKLFVKERFNIRRLVTDIEKLYESLK